MIGMGDEFCEDLAQDIGWGGETWAEVGHDGFELGLTSSPQPCVKHRQQQSHHHYHHHHQHAAASGYHYHASGLSENMQVSVDQYGRPHYKGLYAVAPTDADFLSDLAHETEHHHPKHHHHHHAVPVVVQPVAPQTQQQQQEEQQAPKQQYHHHHHHAPHQPVMQLDEHGRPHYKGLYALDDFDGPLNEDHQHHLPPPAPARRVTSKNIVETSVLTAPTTTTNCTGGCCPPAAAAAAPPPPPVVTTTSSARPKQQQQIPDTETLSSAPVAAVSRVVGGRVEKPKVPKKRAAPRSADAGQADGGAHKEQDSVSKALESAAAKPKIRRYQNTAASRFCHICARSTESVQAISCYNTLFGVCRKIICEKCFEQYGWDWETASKPGARWACAHCKGICPERAQCNTYKRTNQRRRIKGLERRKQLEEMLIAGGADGLAGLVDMQ